MSSPLAGLRVGYVPYSLDLTGPGDRRRFCHYARLAGVDFEIVRPNRRYDVIVLSSLSDLTRWSRWPRDGQRIIFDLPDSYLDIDPTEPRALLRGPLKYVLGQHEHLEWRYHDSLARMCARADAVVCSTPEQAQRIAPFNSNVHPTLDYHTAAAREIKTDFAVGDTLHLLWEGLAGNIPTFEPIAPLLRRLAAQRRIALHLVTDVEFKPFNGPVPKQSTKRLVTRTLPGVPAFLYEWNEGMFPTLCTRCDLALIPMPMHLPLFRAKAENKLLLMWRMAIPTLTAATPAYVRTMKNADVPMTCTDEADWQHQLERYSRDEEARRDAALRGMAYAEREHGSEAITARWNAIFNSALGARQGNEL